MQRKIVFLFVALCLLLSIPVLGQTGLSDRFATALDGQTAAQARLVDATQANQDAAAQQVLTAAELESAESAAMNADADVISVRQQILDYLNSLSDADLLIVIQCGMNGCPEPDPAMTPLEPADEPMTPVDPPAEEPADEPADTADAPPEDAPSDGEAGADESADDGGESE